MSRISLFLAALLCLALSPFASAQSYSSIIVFGDSLSDTGNFADLTQAQYLVRVPGPIANYTDGRFTDGLSTSPAATNYTGVWIEQVAAALATKPAVKASLDGGTNYAYGFASTGDGNSVYSSTANINGTPFPISITIKNIGQQVLDYTSAHPSVPANTLVVVWGGANDLLGAAAANGATQASIQAAITASVTAELTDVQRLITAGAKNIIVPNLPPLGDIPRLNTNATLMPLANTASSSFNSALKTGLTNLQTANPTVTINQLDTFTLFTNAIASPASAGFTNVTASSQGVTGINPDAYLFWDDLHPTTAGHHGIAVAAESLIAPAVTTTTALTSSATNATAGTSITFTANVTAAAGSPTGTVNFSDGATVLGSGTLTANGSTISPTTFATSALATGSHSITATYTGTTGFSTSTSNTVTVTISTPPAPSFTAALSPTTLTLTSGTAGSSTLTVTPMNGFTGSVALACAGLPSMATCVMSPSTLTFTASSTAAQTAKVNISTSSKTPATAFLLFPIASLGLLCALRRRRSNPALFALLLLLSGAGLLGFTGCGGGSATGTASTSTPAGTYPITVTATPTTGSAMTSTLTLIVQ